MHVCKCIRLFITNQDVWNWILMCLQNWHIQWTLDKREKIRSQRKNNVSLRSRVHIQLQSGVTAPAYFICHFGKRVLFCLAGSRAFQAQSRSICLITNNTFKIQTKDASLFFSLYCFSCSGDSPCLSLNFCSIIFFITGCQILH